MYCEKCGNELKGTNFCTACGHKAVDSGESFVNSETVSEPIYANDMVNYENVIQNLSVGWYVVVN